MISVKKAMRRCDLKPVDGALCPVILYLTFLFPKSYILVRFCYCFNCMFISVISTPVQSSFNSLQGDISQQMETVMNGVSSQKEKMTELERRIEKVNMYLCGQEYSRLMRLRRFCLPINVTDY